MDSQIVVSSEGEWFSNLLKRWDDYNEHTSETIDTTRDMVVPLTAKDYKDY